MKLLKEIISINTQFSNAVNIKLDLNDREKTADYIPTASSSAILNHYFTNILKNTAEKASILIGPYGKGKSHLLLFLTAVLSMPYQKKEELLLQSAADKFMDIDKKTGEMLIEIRKNKLKFMPVFLNDSYKELKQSFFAALNEALVREGLEQLIPDTYYSEALNAVDNWKKNFNNTYQRFLFYLKEGGWTEKEFLSGLNNYEESCYLQFIEWYPQLTSGSPFNPMVQNDVITIINEVNQKICQDYGYAGSLFIFDEFSKFMESETKEKAAADMKLIQDLCELASHSWKEQFHVILVAHKSMKQYGEMLDSQLVNAYSGVEGRLEEILFISSARNSYDLIASTIKIKEEDRLNFIRGDSRYDSILMDCSQFSGFSMFFTENEYRNTILKGCFPLHPMTAYFLLNISEQAAQNERTLFTFLAKNEPFTLMRFIQEQKPGEDFIVLPDYIYDYFTPAFRRDKTNQRIHREWLKSDYVLSKIKTEEDKRLIKIIALFSIVNRPEEIGPVKEALMIASLYTEDKFDEVTKRLIREGYLSKRKTTGFYELKQFIGTDLEEEIKHQVKLHFEQLEIGRQLMAVTDFCYLYPKIYNQKYRITRFFKYIFMEYEHFLDLMNAEYLWENEYADGIIVGLVYNTDADVKKITEKIKVLNEERLIVLLPKEAYQNAGELRKLSAVLKLERDTIFLEEYPILKEELHLYKEDLMEAVLRRMHFQFLPEQGGCRVFYMGKEMDTEKNRFWFLRLLGDICEKYYCNAPVINHELINKHQISSQMKRARENLTADFISKADVSKYLDGTAPEATVYRALFLHTGIISGKYIAGIKEVFAVYMDFIEACSEDKQSFSKLYQTLMGKGYGFRKGLIPIYLAYHLAKSKHILVIYFKEKEVGIKAEILEQINKCPENYYLYREKQSEEKEEYLVQLAESFEYQFPDGSQNQAELLWNKIIQWYYRLPVITKAVTIGTGKESEKINKLRRLFLKADVNPSSAIFEQIPQILETDNYAVCSKRIENLKHVLTNYVPEKINCLYAQIKELFDAGTEKELNIILLNWQRKITDWRQRILDKKTEGFMEFISINSAYNHSELINHLSLLLLDTEFYNWHEGSEELFFHELQEVKKNAEGISEKRKGNKFNIVFSDGKKLERYFERNELGTGEFLKNAICDNMEEFGESLTKEEKIAVMIDILCNLLEQRGKEYDIP